MDTTHTGSGKQMFLCFEIRYRKEVIQFVPNTRILVSYSGAGYNSC